MNLFEKIQNVRVELANTQIKMTGKNKFANYDYFELDDFVKPLNAIMLRYKMTAVPSFTPEAATLTAYDFESEQTLTVSSPFAGAELKGCHAVQNVGAVETYQRRYLYQAMFDITESDALNKGQGATPPPSKKQPDASAANDTGETLPWDDKPAPVCADCGAEITAYKGVPAAKVAETMVRRHGVAVCIECGEKRTAAKNAAKE
jgi:hypothetical protein